MNLNKTFIIGNLTRDPERRSLPSGMTVVSMGVATNRVYISQGQKQQEVEFHNVVLFGKQAEVAAQYLKKGSSVFIEGRIKTRNWQDQQGQKHYKTEIIAERMQLGPKPAFSSGAGFNQQPSPAPVNNAGPSEEIPVIEETTPVAENPAVEGLSEDEGEIDVSKIPF